MACIRDTTLKAIPTTQSIIMTGPRIKVEADLSSFDAQIQQLKNSISQLGEKLRTESGKADLNFSGPQKQLRNEN